MARLILRWLAAATLLLGSTAVMAEPITGIVLFTIGTTAVTVGTALFVLSVASSVYGSIQAKKKARAAAQRAAEVEAANLKDRTTSILSADSPWPVIYGQPSPVGGSIVAVLVSGDVDQYKHIVYVLASHECAGVDEIFIGGESIGNRDIAGYADGPGFRLDDGVPRTETHAFELVAMSEPGDETSMSGEGYWILPVGLDADRFSVNYIRDQAGNSYGSTVQQTTSSPAGFGARALRGPIGAKGTIQYTVDGAGSALNVQVHLSPGGVDTADAFLRAARPDLWTVDHKLSGFTYLVVTVDLRLERFQGGVPEITARVRGKKVYDYRTGQTVYSRNPALCLADFIRSEAGYKAGADQIEVDAVIGAANACDVAVYDPAVVNVDPATFGFSTARYTCDGMFRSDQDRDATRQQIEDAMVGFSLESGGVWRIQAGAWSTPVLSLTDDDMVMPMAIVQTCNVGTARYNGAKGSYVNATRLGVTEDFTPYVNANFRAQDVKDKFLDTTLSFTGNHIRTQQISRVLVEQSRGGFVVQVFPKMFAWNLQPGDRIVLSSGLYAFTNKTFRVQDWTYQAGTPVALQCVEDVEDFYDQIDETRADAAPNTSLPSPFLKPAPPLDLVVLSGESQMVQQDGVMIVRAKVQWAQSPDQYVRQYANGVWIEWRAAGTDDAWQKVTLPGDSTEHYLLGLQVNRVYVIRVAFVTPYASSAWSVVSHELHGLEGPPDSVLGLDVRPELTGIFAYWDEPAGIDLLGWSATQIRRGLTWELAEDTVLFDGRASSANLGWFPAGSQIVWAAHHNTTGKWSAPVYDTIEILRPKQPLPTASAVDGNRIIVLIPNDVKGTQPIAFLEVSLGEEYGGSVVLAQFQGKRFETTQSEFGRKVFWVVAVDVAGNRSAPGYAAVVVLSSPSSQIGSIKGTLQGAIDELALAQLEGVVIADEKLGTAQAGIYERVEAIVTDQKAMATQFEGITASFDDFQAFATSKITVLADQSSASASRVDILAVKTETALAGIVEESTTRVSAVNAVASQVTTVQSSVSALGGTVGALTATVQIQANTVANLDGNLGAQLMLRTEVIGSTGKRGLAGISTGATSSSGGTLVQSEIILFADRVLVANDPTATVLTPLLKVEGGIVYIETARIKNADIDTLKVAGYALSVTLSASGAGMASVSFTVPPGQIWRVSPHAFALNGPSVTRNSASPYTAYLSLTDAPTSDVTASLIGGGGENGGGIYRSGAVINETTTDYPAGARTITAAWSADIGTGDGSPPTVRLTVRIEKRGA
ncbi:DUF1983 domain-containing protein [Comamonadaceae bacterium OTU4NAUVB1]|nr:DUF1983 domain-containing protein [Comamonadaceae bacterium OTU4NAUVB1]